MTNISPETSLEELREHIKSAGAIANAKFTYKGYKMRKAAIEFEKTESVKQVINKFNQTKLKEHELTIQEFQVKERAERPPRKPRSKTAENRETPKPAEKPKGSLDDLYKSGGDKKYAAKKAAPAREVKEEKKEPQ